MNERNTVTVKEAAARLDVCEETIRAGLITGTLPIGRAVKGKKRFTFIIPQKRFEIWESGEDLKTTNELLKSIKLLKIELAKITELAKQEKSLN